MFLATTLTGFKMLCSSVRACHRYRHIHLYLCRIRWDACNQACCCVVLFQTQCEVSSEESKVTYNEWAAKQSGKMSVCKY